jgi:Fe-S cluster assembly iron-binding protein IscA
MTITIAPEARRALIELLAREPERRGFRITYAGGCGALGYRMTAAGARGPHEVSIDVEGITIHLDYKSRQDLDGARIEIGAAPDDVVIVHDRAIVGGAC